MDKSCPKVLDPDKSIPHLLMYDSDVQGLRSRPDASLNKTEAVSSAEMASIRHVMLGWGI